MLYTAHIIFYFENTPIHHGVYSVWENIYLVSCKDEVTAENLALLEASEVSTNNSNDSSLRYNDKPAIMKVAGIRKLITADIDVNTHGLTDYTTDQNQWIFEASYSEYTVKSMKEIESLVNNEPTKVIYES